MISVPSNNATFDRSEMTYQQLAMSRVRAVEHSRTVIVPVTSGVSAIIRPDGTIMQQTSMFMPDALVEKVPLRTSADPRHAARHAAGSRSSPPSPWPVSAGLHRARRYAPDEADSGAPVEASARTVVPRQRR